MNVLTATFRSLSDVFGNFVQGFNPDGRSFYIPASDSGIPVTEKSVQQISAFISGLRLLSESFGSLTLKLQLETESSITTQFDHPSYFLACKKPNGFQQRQVFFETAMKYCVLRGNHFAAILRDNDGRPTEIIPVHESKKVNVYLHENKKYYRVEGIQELIPDENMLHFKGLGDGVIGIGCVEYAMTTSGITLASQKNQANFYKGGSQLDGVLEHPKQLSKDAATRLRETWHQTYHSNDPNARVAVLEEGMVYKPISVSPEAAKYLETLKHGYYDIAAILRVPPHMIGLMDKSSFNNIEHQGLEYAKYSLLPWVSRFEQELWDKLLTEKEKREGQLKFRFNMDVLMRGDYKTRMEGYRTGIYAGFFSQNDVLKMEGMAPFEGGDKRWMQMNMMPIDMAEEILTRSATELAKIALNKKEDEDSN
jgi:HK97 family phage portal protein